MRRFVELSAAYYGFKARMFGRPEWFDAAHEAMDHRQTKGLQALIERNTTEGQQRPKGESTASKEAGMAENQERGTTSVSLRKAAAATREAAKAVAKIDDPARRADAQKLLDSMRRNEANLDKAQRRGEDQDRTTNKPDERETGVRRDRGKDFER